MVILKGTDYNQARLAGVRHEAFVAKTGKIPPKENVVQYGDGSIISIVEEIEVDGVLTEVTSYGLLLDETSQYYEYLPDVHKNRCIDYVTTESDEV